jgi:ATP phosphoribosyltransferase regulatory subunit
LSGLQAAVEGPLLIDLADARVLRGVLEGVHLPGPQLQDIVQALTEKDASALAALTGELPNLAREGLQALLRLYGGDEVLAVARDVLPKQPLVATALQELHWLATHLRSAFDGLQIGYDLCDMSGYAYYSGLRFAVYAPGCVDALARGGRYDEVGAVFGRNRPAVGFSLDVKSLALVARPTSAPLAIRAPWSEEPELRSAVRRLRDAGEIVLSVLPGDGVPTPAFECDRELVRVADRWVLQPLPGEVPPTR